MTKKIIATFLLFIVSASLVGAGIALINHYFRVVGMESKVTTVVLIAIMVVIYYKLWKWLCRKIDKIEKS